MFSPSALCPAGQRFVRRDEPETFFDCGNDTLNLWLRQRARANEQRAVLLTLVLCPANNQSVIAYACLSAGALRDGRGSRGVAPQQADPAFAWGKGAACAGHQWVRRRVSPLAWVSSFAHQRSQTAASAAPLGGCCGLRAGNARSQAATKTLAFTPPLGPLAFSSRSARPCRPPRQISTARSSGRSNQRQAEAPGAIQHPPGRLAPSERPQLIEKLALRAALLTGCWGHGNQLSSAVSSRTASGMAWHTRSNGSGVSRRSGGSRSGAGSRSNGVAEGGGARAMWGVRLSSDIEN